MQEMHPNEQHYTGGYAGDQTAAQSPQYSAYDDNFVEALAQRIVQRQSSNSQGKLYSPASQGPNPAAARLGVTIVGLIVLVPLAGILAAGVGGVGGIIAFIVAAIAIISIVATYLGTTQNH